MKALFSMLAAAAALLSSAPSQAATPYRIEELPLGLDLRNCGETCTVGFTTLNNAGLAGGYFINGDLNSNVLYGGRNGLVHPPDASSRIPVSSAVGFNDRGRLLFMAEPVWGEPVWGEPVWGEPVQAYVYDTDRGGSRVPVGADPALPALGLELDRQGRVLARDSRGEFLWDDGQVRRLDGSLRVSAFNDAGVLVGRGTAADTLGQAYQVDPAGRVAPLSGLADAFDVNNAGQVLGVTQTGAAALRDADGTLHLLDAGLHWGTRLNDLGWVLGASQPGPRGVPYLYRDGQAVRLDDLVRPRDAPDWALDIGEGLAFNDRGQLVGLGHFGNRPAPFLATPVPEPASALLLLGGCGAVGWTARRRRHGTAPAGHRP